MADTSYLREELYSLIRSDERIFNFIEQSCLDGVWCWDLEKPDEEWLSPKLWTILGYDPAMMPHRVSSWQDIIFPDDLEVARRNLSMHCQDASHPYDQTVRYRHADGSTVWIRCRGIAIRDVHGRAKRLLGVHTDVTELVKGQDYELELRKSEQKFRGIFNSTFSFIGFLNTEGILLEANQTALDMAGLKLGDVIGKYFWDCYWWQISEEAQCVLKKNVLLAAKGHECVYEAQVLLANNTSVTIHFSLKPVFGSDGRVHYILPEGRPIQDLVDTRKRYQSVIEGTNVGTWEWNVQTGETRFNERWAEMAGYTLDELDPVSIETWEKLSHPDDFKDSSLKLQECFDKKVEYYEAECRVRHKNGDWVWVLDRGKVFSWSDDGKPLMMYGTHQDITEKKVAEDQLRRSEAAFKNNFNYAGIGMALVGLGGEWIKVNEKLCQIVGYSEADLLSLTFQDITHPDDLDKDLALLQEVIVGARENYQMEKRYIHKDGNIVHIILAVSVVREDDGSPINFISQIIDISEQKRAENTIQELLDASNQWNSELVQARCKLEDANLALRKQSITDELTGLYNRRAFNSYINKEISRVNRNESKALSLIFIDVDHFKNYNDDFGHAEGDVALQVLAAIFSRTSRSYDIVSRYGGEEFAIILPDTDEKSAVAIARRICSEVESEPWPLRTLTISAGITTCRSEATVDALVLEADMALYQAKADGRNRVVHSVDTRAQAK